MCGNMCLCNCRCLDLIFHAEHKSILEEMWDDYDLAHVKTSRGNNYEGSFSFDGCIGPNGRELDAVMSNSQKIDKYDGATGSAEPLISSTQDILGFPSISFLEYINKVQVGGSRFVSTFWILILYSERLTENFYNLFTVSVIPFSTTYYI